MKTLIFCMAALFAIKSNTGITGTWNVVSGGSSFTSVNFTDNGLYNCFIDGELALKGTYTFDGTDSTLIVEDEGCFDIIGKYKVHLFGNADSVRFTPINDDCYERKVSVQSALLSRKMD